MKVNLTKFLVLVLVVMLLALTFGCNTRTSEPKLTADYILKGSLIADPNLDSTLVVLSLKKNDSLLSTAAITFDGDSLIYNSIHVEPGYIYSLVDTSLYTYLSASKRLVIKDSSSFYDTVLVGVPDTFSITNIDPANRLLPGGGSVAVDWSGSTNADGYVVATVLRDSAYTGQGYSFWSTTLNTADNIPAEAFVDGVTTVFGWYYIYVYAYTGMPDSSLASEILPVPLPEQLTSNISIPDMDGTFGSIVVCYRDSVNVYASSR
ncbi:MAG: hypothetical protein ACOYVF_03810 [Candidatus Zixiibacteriota bacterium]